MGGALVPSLSLVEEEVAHEDPDTSNTTTVVVYASMYGQLFDIEHQAWIESRKRKHMRIPSMGQ